MLLLALDTSTSAITVAVRDAHATLAEHTVTDARRHSEHLAPGVSAVLAAAGARPGEVTDVAVGTGPGPFTGLRVGIVTALAFGYARGVPVHGVCSLDALAHAAMKDGGDDAGGSDAETREGAEGDLLVATDARRREVYWATYARVGRGAGAPRAVRVTGPHVARPADLPPGVRALPTVGRAPLLYPDHLGHGRAPLDVSAAALAELAVQRLRAGDPMPVEPLYLRRPDAAAPVAPKSTLVPPPPGRTPPPGRAGSRGGRADRERAGGGGIR